jgi:hypothetical protein
MSRDLVSILNPTLPEALKVTLGRRVFVREIALSLLLSLPVPMVCMLAISLSQTATDLAAVAIGTISAVAVMAMPILFYASFRMNAATLARERAVLPPGTQRIHGAMKGPFLLRNAMVAGSVRSRIRTGFPVTIAGILTFSVVAYLTMGSLVMPLLHPLLGIVLLLQGFVMFKLLRHARPGAAEDPS